MRQAATIQQADEPLKSTNPQPLEGRLSASHNAPAMPKAVPVHFNRVVMRGFYPTPPAPANKLAGALPKFAP